MRLLNLLYLRSNIKHNRGVKIMEKIKKYLFVVSLSLVALSLSGTSILNAGSFGLTSTFGLNGVVAANIAGWINAGLSVYSIIALVVTFNVGSVVILAAMAKFAGKKIAASVIALW